MHINDHQHDSDDNYMGLDGTIVGPDEVDNHDGDEGSS